MVVRPNRDHSSVPPLHGAEKSRRGIGAVPTSGEPLSRGGSSCWERLPPTSRLLCASGGRDLPPFACGSGGGQSWGQKDVLPPMDVTRLAIRSCTRSRRAVTSA